MIDKFEFTDFHPSKYVIDAYRKKLIEYVEDGVRQNLVSLCSSSLVEEVKRAKEEMIEGLTNVIKVKTVALFEIISNFDLMRSSIQISYIFFIRILKPKF